MRWAKLKPTNDSWRVDKTYIKVKGMWLSQYRVVDSAGHTLDFRPSVTPKLLLPSSRKRWACMSSTRCAYNIQLTSLRRLLSQFFQTANQSSLGQTRYNYGIFKQAKTYVDFVDKMNSSVCCSGLTLFNHNTFCDRTNMGDILAKIHLINHLFGLTA